MSQESKKQTAVEWLVEQYAQGNYGWEAYTQAKEMEKEQKKDAWVDGNHTQRCIANKEVDECFDNYYTEVYGKE